MFIVWLVLRSLDGCLDGDDGFYYTDESIEQIVVKSNGCQKLRAGELATIVATVYAYEPDTDTADFFYATNASNPVWVYIGSAKPTVSDGLTDIEMTYTIPTGSDVQAVRVQFTYIEGPSTDPCISGYFNERDDIVFKVLPWVAVYGDISNIGICSDRYLSGEIHVV